MLTASCKTATICTMDIRVKFDAYLGLSAYRVAQAAKGRVAQGSVYALARGDAKRLDLNTLAAVMGALEELTGERVTFDDLLERAEPGEVRLTAAGVPYTGDEETDWWLDNQPDILERVHELGAGETKLIPIENVAAELGLKLER